MRSSSPSVRGLLVALSLLLAAGCSASDVPSGAATAPRGTPEAVVLDYLEAVAAGDRATVRELSSPAFDERMAAAADSWYSQEVTFTDIALGERRDADGSGTATRFAQVVHIPVAFDIEQERDLSLPNGETVWGFTLGRQDDTEPWVIDDMGT